MLNKLQIDYSDDAIKNPKYLALPKIAQYVKIDPARYEKPKCVFKHLITKLGTLINASSTASFADIACANGEFLYQLRKSFPSLKLFGYDEEPTFVETANHFEGLRGVNVEVGDLFKLTGQFDFVSFLGTMSIFWDPSKPLNQLLSLLKPGGVLFVDGYFNPNEIEMRCSYQDNSVEEGRGRWRRDWSVMSQSGIRHVLSQSCESVEFEEIIMDVDIPRSDAKPHIFAWTFKDENGRRHLTHGGRMIIDDVMLIARKRRA